VIRLYLDFSNQILNINGGMRCWCHVIVQSEEM
jgi:hypothetical protein